MKQSPGKIYLADQRGYLQTKQFQRFSTFNFEDYFQEHKRPFGDLYVLNEETLAGSQSLTFSVDRASYILILPITGAVCLTTTAGNPVRIEAGELQIITAPAKFAFLLENPYSTEIIQFLHLRINTNQPVNTIFSRSVAFNLNSQAPLTGIISAGKEIENLTYPFSLHLGRFAGRQEVVYSLEGTSALFFAFVIAGAFEAEGRLLHEKDGLALWDIDEVELEALSNNALILILKLEK